MKLKKNIQLKYNKKKPESTWLTRKTRDPCHEIVITPYKVNKKIIIKFDSQSTQY
jgi:hypothetical protein